MESGADVKALLPLTHIGIVVIVVKDIDETTKFLSSILGLGPWNVVVDKASKEDMLAGETFEIKMAFAKLGPTVIELLQPLDENSVWAQFLKTKGEGLYNIAFGVSNWDEAVSKLEEHGKKVVLGEFFKGRRWCEYDTKPGEILLELIECKDANELTTALCHPSDTGAKAISALTYWLGFAPKDVDKTIEFLSATLGIGPWKIIIDTPSKEDVPVGEQFKVKLATANFGPVILELLQPLDDKSIWAQIIKTKGEKLCAITFTVTDYDHWVSKFRELGQEMVLASVDRNTFPEPKRWCYFATNPGGIMFEFLEA
ncbi:VOC family protein [Chloroflexota bacterium]